MRFNESQDPKLEEQLQKATKGKEVGVISEYIIIGKEGAAIQVKDTDFIPDWYDIPGAKPRDVAGEKKATSPKTWA